MVINVHIYAKSTTTSTRTRIIKIVKGYDVTIAAVVISIIYIDIFIFKKILLM